MSNYLSVNLRTLSFSLTACCGLFLVSCLSTHGVVSIGDNEFYISKATSHSIAGTEVIKTEALKKAGDFCNSKNKSLDIINLFENEGPFGFGNFPRIELTFSCE